MKRPTVPAIISLVSREYGIRPKDITGRRRPATLIEPRQVAMWLCRKTLRSESLTTLGQKFRRDHGTILYSVKIIENQRSVYPELRTRTDALLSQIEMEAA